MQGTCPNDSLSIDHIVVDNLPRLDAKLVQVAYVFLHAKYSVPDLLGYLHTLLFLHAVLSD